MGKFAISIVVLIGIVIIAAFAIFAKINITSNMGNRTTLVAISSNPTTSFSTTILYNQQASSAYCLLANKSDSVYSNFSCSSPNRLIDFIPAVSNVTITCNSASANQTLTLIIRDNQNITIKNCKLGDVSIIDSRDIALLNNQFMGGEPVTMTNVNSSTISNNRFYDNYIGIALYGSNNNTLSNNLFEENGGGYVELPYEFFGIELTSSSTNKITNNSGGNFTGALIALEGSSNKNIIEKNIANFDYDDGIVLSDGPMYNILRNNTANADDSGIELLGALNNILENNTVSGNVAGIFLNNGAGCDANETILNNSLNSDANPIASDNSCLADQSSEFNNQNKEGYLIINSIPGFVDSRSGLISILQFKNGTYLYLYECGSSNTNGILSACISVAENNPNDVYKNPAMNVEEGQSVTAYGVTIRPFNIAAGLVSNELWSSKFAITS
jgi:parallel beta-helix repeat protein